MEYHQIRNFRPVETKTENTDQDRTVLRLCDGFLAVPQGALCSWPKWDHALLVVWSLALSQPLAAFYVTTGTPALNRIVSL